jgi:peptidoglycan hydrolase CwlO-like protein
MSALQRLQEKIEQLKNSYEGMKYEVGELRSQLESASSGQNEQQNIINQLRHELEEKDREIEAIISKVEELLA